MTWQVKRLRPISGFESTRSTSGVGVAIAIMIFGVLVAALIPLLPLKLIIYVLGAIGGLFLLVLDIEKLLIVTVAVAFLVVGPVEYFSGMRIIWLVSGLALLVMLKSILQWVGNRQRAVATAIPMPGLFALLFIFFAVQLLATLMQRPSSSLLMIEIRDRFLPWVLLLPFLTGQITLPSCQRIWRFIIAVGFIQLPFVLVQYFLYARKRTDDTWWDAIVGSFIGDPRSGGDSGAMALFVISVAALLVAAWRFGILPGKRLVVMLPLVLSSIFLTEVKVAMVLIPLATIALFWKDIIRRPALGIGVITLSAVLVVSIYLAYGVVFGQTRTGTGGLDSSIKFTFDPSFIKSSGEMGRYASLYYWWKHGGDTLGIPGYVFGNGIGASNSDNPLDLGPIARRKYPIHIAATGISKLLWESGVTGTLTFLGALVLLFFKTKSLLTQIVDRKAQSLLLGFSAILLMSMAHLFYTKAVAGHMPQIYLLLVILVGSMLALDNVAGRKSA